MSENLLWRVMYLNSDVGVTDDLTSAVEEGRCAIVG